MRFKQPKLDSISPEAVQAVAPTAAQQQRDLLATVGQKKRDSKGQIQKRGS